MTTKQKVNYLILRTIGNFLVLFSIFSMIATFGPALYYEAMFRISQLRGVEYEVIASVDDTTSPLGQLLAKEGLAGNGESLESALTGPKKQILVPRDPSFNILIPKIGANSKVYPNVDPEREELFQPYLLSGVAHAEGTVFPGMSGNVYLFAHSADNFWDVGRYNAVFYLIKDLVPGDDVVVFFENVRHNYVVTESRVVDASEVSHITDAQTGKEQLILQTCWPPGTTWKRLLVFARPK